MVTATLTVKKSDFWRQSRAAGDPWLVILEFFDSSHVLEVLGWIFKYRWESNSSAP